MNEQIQAVMTEATRLTRAGRLAEATALIQRTLGGMPAATGWSSHADAPTKAEISMMDDPPSLPEPTSQERVEGSPARAGGHREVAPQEPSADVLHLPAGLHSPTGRGPLLRPGKASPSSHPGGRFVDGAYSNTAGMRPYKLYIPRNATGQAVPLVVMLHGCTQNAIDFATGTRMNRLAEEKTFLVAYPEQTSSANHTRCWNWFEPTDQLRGSGEPSLIAGITQQIIHAYHVDVNRVYVAGMSAGGAMAVIMAATYPDLYAAVGVHSGLAYGVASDLPSGFAAMRRGAGRDARRLSRVIPLIVFHGDRDTTVSPVNAHHLVDQWLQATSHEQDRSAQNAKVERGQVANGQAYTKSLYHDASGRVTVEMWLVHQAGHAWSGGSPEGSFTDPRGPDASTELLRFFAQQSRKQEEAR
ncbi:MAG TPA: PHB depolymerase family esterase [Ktedonobacteraceae bacterium]|nr:PHB depolymerase family esterase [Ktedonobacteraceae bacterium]